MSAFIAFGLIGVATIFAVVGAAMSDAHNVRSGIATWALVIRVTTFAAFFPVVLAIHVAVDAITGAAANAAHP